jgi:hypothetical protein
MLNKLSPQTLNLLNTSKPVLNKKTYKSFIDVVNNAPDKFTKILCKHNCQIALDPGIREDVQKMCDENNFSTAPDDVYLVIGKQSEYAKRIQGLLDVQIRDSKTGHILASLPWERYFSPIAMQIIRNNGM